MLSTARTPGGRLAIVLIIFAAITCLFLSPLFRGHTLLDVASRQNELYPWAYRHTGRPPTLHFDQADKLYPWQVFINRSLRAGEFPLWNPYNFAGQPFFANGKRAYLVPRCERVESSLVALKVFTSPYLDPRRAVIVEAAWLPETARIWTGDDALQPEPTGSVQIASRSLNTITLNVNAGRDGWLVVNETWDPGWTATVDGSSVPVLPGNYAFRTLQVPAGQHTVEMVYKPAAFRIGRVISGGTIGLLLIITAVWQFRHSGHHGASPLEL